MRTFTALPLSFLLLTTLGAAQVQRTSGQSQDVHAARRQAHRRSQARQEARVDAATSASTASRRQAIVVLTAPTVIDQMAATTPRKADARGVLRADTELVRARTLSSEGDRYAQTLRQAKAPLVSQLEARGVTIRAQTEHVLNAVMIHATAEDLAWLRLQPGVKSAEFSKMRRLSLNTATSIIGAPTVWNQLGGSSNAGKGQMIAMIDSGIDPSIPMMNPAGMSAPSGFPKTNATAGSGNVNGKIIVAKNYICTSAANSSCSSSPVTSFDRSATDGLGHGTGTASVAGGACVSTTPMGVPICGVAPGAFLGNYKVFDSAGNGSDADFLTALNDAVTDGFTIINYSGGGDATGEQPTASSDYDAIHAAAAAGVVVTVSAGNCGPYGGGSDSCSYDGDNTVSDPAIVPDTIALGASSNSHVLANPFTVTSSSLTIPANLQSIGAEATQDGFSGTVAPTPVADVTPLDGNGTACTSLPAGSLTGKVAIIRYSDYCLDTDQINHAAAAGAVAAIMADNYPEDLLFGFNFLYGGNIQSTWIGYFDANALIALANANPGKILVSFGTANVFAPQAVDQVADYSSRGPTNDLMIKPDLLAPGDMYIASQTVNRNGEIYDSSGYLYSSGTSYAAPMTAGAIAILKQQHPTWTAQDLKSAVVNTATLVSATQDNAVISVMHQGGGRLNLPAAMATTLTANPVSASFGQIASPTGGATQSVAVTLKNVGAGSENFTVTVNPSLANSALQISTDKATVSLAAGATTTLNITAALNATSYGVFEGTVVLTSQSTPTVIHIPYWLMLGAPTINAGGLVDGASFGKTVAPGDIVSVFGTSLGTLGFNAQYLPLPTDLNHTQVTINGSFSDRSAGEYPVPLFFSRADQVNFQIPFDLSPCARGGTGCDTLAVYLQGIAGNTLKFQIAPTAPGIFSANGSGIVVHSSTNALVTAASPATAGEIVTIYCSGLGAVNQAFTVYEGDPSPIPAATTAATATVSIGGTPAAVSFSGLSPNLAGLYQINATVGAGTGKGTQPITITIGGATSTAVNTFVQ